MCDKDGLVPRIASNKSTYTPYLILSYLPPIYHIYSSNTLISGASSNPPSKNHTVLVPFPPPPPPPPPCSATSLNGPTGVALDSSGGLYVSDFDNHRVLYFAAGRDRKSVV